MLPASHSRPHPKFLLEKAPKLTWLENSSQFSEQNYLQMHGTAMGTNMSVAFSNIFMAKIAMQILDKGVHLETHQ